MRRLLSWGLCIALLLSSSIIVRADETTTEVYNTINVEFSDKKGSTEPLKVMMQNNNVYVNAEEIGLRLGYQVSITEKYVSIYNKEANKNVPYGMTVFYYDKAKADHMIFNKMVEYETPFECVKNNQGIWIPLEYSLFLLNSSLLIVNDTILIDMPRKNIIDIYMDILKNNDTYLFDWFNDFGYSEQDELCIGSASHFVNLFNGLLEQDGASWVQIVQMFAMDNSSYDSRYGEAVAQLFCTYSDEELKQEIDNMERMMDNFNSEGTLGKTLLAIGKSVPSDADIGTLQENCLKLKDQIDGSNISIATYNRVYQTLENACDTTTLFEDTAGYVMDAQKEITDSTYLKQLFTIAEVVGYAKEFQNQDEFAVEALAHFVEDTNSRSVMSNAMKEGINNYTTMLRTDIVSYSALQYLKNNYDDIIMGATDFSGSLGTEATLMLIAWDLVKSANILNIGDKIEAADMFELAMYSSIFQSDAFVSYQSIRNKTFESVDSITSENLYEVSQLCYAYLKSCYITRNAALASLKGKMADTQEKIQPLIEQQNSINEEIAGYLVELKDANLTNEKLCYGFLLDNNKQYLKDYMDKNHLVDIVSSKNIEVSEYFENYEELVKILDMQLITEHWQFENWDSYMKEQFYIEGDGKVFSMKNEGNSNIKLYNISLGENIKHGENALKDNGWIDYYSYENVNEYVALLNNKKYMLTIYIDNNENITSWYINNWPDGEDMEEIFSELQKGENENITGVNLNGNWCSVDGKHVFHFGNYCNPGDFADAYYVNFDGDRNVSCNVEEDGNNQIYVKPFDDYQRSYTFSVVNEQLVSDEFVLDKVPEKYTTRLLGEWNNSEYTYEFDENGKYYIYSEETTWGMYYVISDSQIVLSNKSEDFKIVNCTIEGNELLLNDCLILLKEGEYSNSMTGLENLSDVIEGIWCDEEMGMEEYHFYGNGSYERCSVVYNNDNELIYSNCIESGSYTIVNFDTVRINFNGGFTMDFMYDETAISLQNGNGGKVYVKKN